MENGVILGVDIGGSHISTALVREADGTVEPASFCKTAVDAQAGREAILGQWAGALAFSLSKTSFSCVRGIGIAMPGPFDYDRGISLISGVNKYEQLYGVNIKEQLQQILGLGPGFPVYFENDAVCFGLGASRTGKASRPTALNR